MFRKNLLFGIIFCLNGLFFIEIIAKYISKWYNFKKGAYYGI